MKIIELRTKNDTELKSIIHDLKREDMYIRFQKAAGSEGVKLSRVREIKKTIARIKTIVRMRQISGESNA